MAAWTVPFLGTFWCLAVVAFVSTVRAWLQRRMVRRALDAVTGLVLIGSCARVDAGHAGDAGLAGFPGGKVA